MGNVTSYFTTPSITPVTSTTETTTTTQPNVESTITAIEAKIETVPATEVIPTPDPQPVVLESIPESKPVEVKSEEVKPSEAKPEPTSTAHKKKHKKRH